MERGGSKLAEGDAVQMPQPLCGAQGPQTPLRVAGGGRQQLSAPLQLALHDGVMEVHPATLRLGRLPHQHRAVHLPCPQTSAVQRHHNPHQHNPRKHLLYNAITIPTNTTPANACLTTQSYPHRNRPSNAIIYLQTLTLQLRIISPQTPTLQFCYTYKYLLYNAIILPQTPTLQRHYIPTNTYLLCNAIIFPQTHTLQWHYISTNICFTILSYQHKRLPYTIYLQTPTLQFHHINTNTYLTTPSDPHKHLLFNSVIIPQNTFFSFFCFTNLKQKEAQSARAEFRTLINSLAC